MDSIIASPAELRYPGAPMRFWLQTSVWLITLFAGFEVLSRLFIGDAPRTHIHPDYDRVTMPHEQVVQSREGFARGRTNELGHLDAPMPRPLPPDGILVIGDSLTESRQVAAAERFTERLGAALGRRVYNAGHTGWSPLNAIGLLRADLPAFAPGTVIVQVSGNDLADMAARRRPRVVEQGGGFAVRWPNRGKPGGGALTRVRETVSRSAFAENLIARTLELVSGDGPGDDGGGGAASCDSATPLVVRALPWVLGQLKALHPDVRLLYLPRLDYHAGCVDKCAGAARLWRDAARGAGVPMVDVTGAMCRRFRATRQPLNGFWNTEPGIGHLNGEGHAVVAGELAGALGAGGARAVRP